MDPCLCIVFASALAAAPVAEFERLERRMQELVEQERFEELARDGESAFRRTDLEPWQRRELAFYALRGYHRMFAATGQATGLCRARGLLRRVEREVGLGEDEAIAARLRKTTEEGLRQQGQKDVCGAAKGRAPSGVPTSTPAELLPVKPERPATSPPPADDLQPVLIDISASRPRPARPPRPPRPAASVTPEAQSATSPPPSPPPSLPPSPPPADPQPQSRPHDRIVAGSVLLLVGTGLGAGMAAALVRRSEANGEIVKLGQLLDKEDRGLTDEEFNRVSQLIDTYRELTPVAGVAGAACAIATITGVTLLALPQRGRTTAAVSASPWSATLTLSGRF